MVKHFHIGNPNDASFYAGILISAFALSESLTGMLWGALSDRIGRKPVLLIGCVGTALSLVIVGFSKSFWMALLGRIGGGILNGNIGECGFGRYGKFVSDMMAQAVFRPWLGRWSRSLNMSVSIASSFHS